MDVLGIDIGGVIIDRVNEGTDTSFFSENYLESSPTPDVFESLARLVDQKFGDQVFLVSKASKPTQKKTLEWLDHNRFAELTGITLDHVRFCLKRSDKAPIAAELGLTHFIDDKLEVLSYLTTAQHQYLYRPLPKEVRRYAHHLDRVTVVKDWKALADSILLPA